MQGAPEISVAVTTRNRSVRLEGMLRSLADQTLDKERFEVVVVDDGSTDGTGDSLASSSREGRLQLRVVGSPGSGLAAARNASWGAARAPLVAFIDDDCEATPKWLEGALAEAAEHPGVIIQGPTTPIPRELELTGPFTRTKDISEPNPSYQTCNIVYPRVVLERTGGFDERLREQGEDTDLGWRARELGVDLHWSDRVRVHHAVDDLGPTGFLRTALRGADAVRVFKRHPELREEGLRWGIVRYAGMPGLALALVAIRIARRSPVLALLLALPYARHLARTCRRRRASFLLAPYYLLWDLLFAYTALRGSLRHRTLVL